MPGTNMFLPKLFSTISRAVPLFDYDRSGVLNKGRDFDARPRSPALGSLSVDLSSYKLHWASDDPMESISHQTAGFVDNRHRRARSTRFRSKLWRFGFTRRSPRNPQPPPETCMGCFDSMLVDTLSCGHKYCSQCINRMASMALKNEISFPPKCCSKKIPLQKVLRTMSPQKQQLYTSKMREYATPISRRRYCPAPDCTKWIPPEFLKDGASSHKCPYCGLVICSSYRYAAHASSDCPSDPELSAVLEEARIQQWQRCYNCGALVELTFGCNHITCNCKAQFCYKCGDPWPSCACVAPADRPLDFLPLTINNNAQNGDEEAELAAVITAVICADRDHG